MTLTNSRDIDLVLWVSQLSSAYVREAFLRRPVLAPESIALEALAVTSTARQQAVAIEAQELVVAVAAAMRALCTRAVALMPVAGRVVHMSRTGSDTDVAAG